MTYFNPKIYNKQNLKEKDRKELEYWNDVFTNIIENAKFDCCPDDDGDTIKKIQYEIIERFCRDLRINLGWTMQDHVIAIIDDYDESIAEVENYETFFYIENE